MSARVHHEPAPPKDGGPAYDALDRRLTCKACGARLVHESKPGRVLEVCRTEACARAWVRQCQRDNKRARKARA